MQQANLERCSNGCFFIDGKVATQPEYEEAKRRHPGSYAGIAPGGRNANLETIIACRKARSEDLDPIPQDVRAYLHEHFGDVKDEIAQGDYYVFSVKLTSGHVHELKVHRNLFVFSNLVADYLREHDFAGQLKRGNVEITKPLTRA